MTDEQNLRYELLKAAQYNIEKAAEQYSFIAGQTKPQERQDSSQHEYDLTTDELRDGVYLIFPDEANWYCGQRVGPEAVKRCKGVGIKLGEISFGIALHDTSVEGSSLMPLTVGESSQEFNNNLYDLVDDMNGEGDTASIDNLNPAIHLGPNGECIPSIGGLMLTALYFKRINEALLAVGGTGLNDTIAYWSSSRMDQGHAWSYNFGSASVDWASTTCELMVRLVFDW